MSGMADLAIRGGLIVDGTGGVPFKGDVIIGNGVIRAIGAGGEPAREEIDATGLIVTPGFVDIHTHYDGQITWEETLAPSSQHGVTTVVMGNCGVGFAPCRPEMRQSLMNLMEGVEDIPGVVMAEGVPWAWESFPEYLDFLEGRRCDVDFATQVPHGPVRVHAMGERGLAREPATAADIAAMANIVKEGIAAGALGFSTTRTLFHRSRTGELAPSVTAGEDELRGIAVAMGELGQGVIEVADFFEDTTPDHSTGFDMWKRIVQASGRPLSYGLLEMPDAPDRWRDLLRRTAEANGEGLAITAQVSVRPVGTLFGLGLSSNPFSACPSYAPIANLPLAGRVEKMRDPALREALLAETPVSLNQTALALQRNVGEFYELGSSPDYSPPLDEKFSVKAARLGVSPLELAYDTLLHDGGRAILYYPFANFMTQSLDPTLAMLSHANSVIGISDGGAHFGMLCDASLPTYLLTYWTRDRAGARIPLQEAIRMLTSATAQSVGLHDRGVLRAGYKADVNVIDYAGLHLHRPHPVHDLPAGGLRLQQAVDGYRATIVSGEVTYRDGVATGHLPGRLIRGAKNRREPE